LQNVTDGRSSEANDNEDADGMLRDLDKLIRLFEHKNDLLLEKERQLRHNHENVSVWAQTQL